MRNSFVWDDTALVLRDPLIRHWRLIPDGFRDFLFLDASASNFYRPMQRLTYTADYALWGIKREVVEGQWDNSGVRKPGPPSPRQVDDTGAPDTGDGGDIARIQLAPQPGWHFTSVLFHLLAALALHWLLRVWLGGGWVPLLGALAWAVHPLHTSAVTYVSGRADPLAGLFAFSALALVARAHAKGGLMPGDRGAARCVIGAAACAFAALLSKESGVAAFTLWLVWIAFKARKNRRAWLAWLGSVLIVVGAYMALRLTADQTPVPPSQRETSLAERPVLAARALAEYATLFVAPHSLHMERDVSIKPADTAATVRFRHLQTAVGALLALGLALWARWGLRRAPDAALALACFVVTWLPISNLFKLNATVAEHWLYVPSAFLISALLATVVKKPVPAAADVESAASPSSENPASPAAAASSRAARAPFLAALGVAWILVLAVQTHFQQSYWSDQKTFVTETMQRAGHGARMLVNLANLAAADRRPEEAIALYRAALAQSPDLAVAHFGLAAAAANSRDFPTALAELAQAEASPLFTANALVLRAQILQAQTGQPRFDLLAQAVDVAPRNWDICRRLPEAKLAVALASKTDRFVEKAHDDLLRQNNIRPYRAEAWRMLGRLLEIMSANAAKAGDAKTAGTLLGSAIQAYTDAADCDLRDERSRAKLREAMHGIEVGIF